MFKLPKISQLFSRLTGHSAPDSEDQSVMTTVERADALATGKDTETSVLTTLRMVDHGEVTIAHGTVKATAAAESDNGDTAFADASTDVLVDGADLIFVFGLDRSGGGSGSSYDQSITMFRAVDIAHWSGPPKVIDFGHWQINGLFQPHVTGNVARADLDTQVHGENTFLAADAFVLAVEDQLSVSTMEVTSAVG